jgi:putative flippase GtrA
VKYFGSLLVYGAVGGAAALVEWASFYAALELADLHYLVAALIGFVFATWVNYLLSARYAFIRKEARAGVELTKVYVVSLLALIVNLGATIALVELVAAHPMAAKVVGTGCGFLLNFAGRQLWVFDSRPRHRLSEWLRR